MCAKVSSVCFAKRSEARAHLELDFPLGAAQFARRHLLRSNLAIASPQRLWVLDARYPVEPESKSTRQLDSARQKAPTRSLSPQNLLRLSLDPLLENQERRVDTRSGIGCFGVFVSRFCLFRRGRSGFYSQGWMSCQSCVGPVRGINSNSPGKYDSS